MTHSRRRVLRLSGGVIATGLAGCLGGTDSGADGGLSVVPAGVSAVARGDVTTTLQDSAVTRLVNAGLSPLAAAEGYRGPTSKAEILETFTGETGLDLAAAERAVGYLKYDTEPSEGYLGFWFEADWTTEDVVDALSTDAMRFEEETYEGRPVYAPTEDFGTLWLGVPDSNAYVAGTESAVKETVDVATGAGEAVGGDLIGAYDSVRSAPFNFATTVPSGLLPQRPYQVGGSTIDPQRFVSVEHVAGATYHEGETVGIVLVLLTGGDSDAETVREALVGVVSAAQGAVRDETIAGALDEITVEQDGSRVRAEVSGSVDRAADLVETLAGLLLG